MFPYKVPKLLVQSSLINYYQMKTDKTGGKLLYLYKVSNEPLFLYLLYQ